MTKTILVGCGACFANDRPDAALRLAHDLAQRNGQRYIMLELLAERTLAEAQLRRGLDRHTGYASRLFDFLEPMLVVCIDAGIPIITTGGAAHPRAAAQRLRATPAVRYPSLTIARVLCDAIQIGARGCWGRVCESV